MKTLIKITVFITTLLVLLFSTTSCFVEGLTGVKGSRVVISEDRDISSDFESIQVQQGIHLYITQGNPIDVKVEADDNIMELLKTEVKNGKLKIYFEKNVYKAKARNVYLTVDEFSSIKSSSGASVKAENTLKLNSLDLDSSSGSSMKIYVNAREITAESSSGSNLTIYGKTTNFSAKSSSGSHINAEDLESVDAVARASSGANINVNVSGKLSAKASSGGDIDYEGSPVDVNKDTSSGGSVYGN